jgi:hypothetical protein
MISRLSIACTFALVACHTERPIGPGMDSTTTSDLGASSQANDLGDPSQATCSRVDDPAQATVHIRVENHASTPRYVGMPEPSQDFLPPTCQSFAVSQGLTRVQTLRYYQCLCECAEPGPTGTDYTKLEPGAATELAIWDGRAIVDCVQKYDCESNWSGLGQVDEHVPHWVRQAPGIYDIQIGYSVDQPLCPSTDGVTYLCDIPRPTYTDLCGAPAYASGTVELPSSGAATATIVLE